MEQFTSFLQNPFSFFSPTQRPPEPPAPSYRGTGAAAARRPTITKQISTAASRRLPSLDPRASISLIDKGLVNRPGENNCFLNAAVQVCKRSCQCTK